MRPVGEWIAASEAGSLLGTSRQWVYQLVRAGRVRSLQTGGFRLVCREDIVLLAGRRSAKGGTHRGIRRRLRGSC